MSVKTAIEWTDATWNPVTGCTKVSAGCDNCYAETFAERWRGVLGHYFERGFDVMERPKMLDLPMAWKRPRRVFVNSMSDLFHRDVNDAYIDDVFGRMESVDRHIYQVLTKRPERLLRYVRQRYGRAVSPAHIWLGVSVENNDAGWRADMLREVNAPVRFLSIEPMIGSVERVLFEGHHWIIVGGESGRGHRPLDISWVRDVRDRCIAARIPFFFKQWHKGETGRLLDGREWNEMPEPADSGA